MMFVRAERLCAALRVYETVGIVDAELAQELLGGRGRERRLRVLDRLHRHSLVMRSC